MSKNVIRFSIRFKMYIFVVLVTIAVAVGTSVIAFTASARQIDVYYKQAASDNARNFASLVDGDFIARLRPEIESKEYQKLRAEAEEAEDEQPVKDFLREKGLWEEYSSTRKMLCDYLEKMEEIKYLYIVAHGDADAEYDMYLIDDNNTELYETGYYEKREEELRGIDLTKLPEPTISNGDWGWLCSDFKPILTSDGRCVGLVGCDFLMDDVMEERVALRFYLILGAVIFIAVVLTGAMLFINKIVISPLNAMTKEMKNFDPKVTDDYKAAGVIDLKIRSHDEIHEIYEGIHAMQINTIDQLNKLYALQEDKLKAEEDLRSKEQQIGLLSKRTYKDALTGMSNKAAYIKKAEELDRLSSESHAGYAIVMVDMNNLKQINNRFGHKAGDIYIKGCCQMVCDAFKHSPVFRIGGDEFVVILQGIDYENRRQITERLKADFEKTCSRAHADLWFRYSAAVGMGERSSDDATVDLVFKRADKAMYENKMQFKKEHGGYR